MRAPTPKLSTSPFPVVRVGMAFARQRIAVAEREAMEFEDEIERQLKRISLSCLEEEQGEEVPLGADPQAAFSDELPDSVLRCLQYAKNRVGDAEKLILEDLEANDTVISNGFEVVPRHASDILAELASEYNEDPEALKTRILAEVEEQDSRDLEISLSSDPNINNIHQDKTFVVIEDSGSYTLDRGDMSVRFDYIEVEERCRKDLKLWEEKHKLLEDETRFKLKTDKEILEKKNHEVEERRRLWQEEFENERQKLEIIQKQQQAKLKNDEKKEKEAWAEELKEHEELINRLQQKMQEEKKTFEEQKEKERQILNELQNKAATTIQSRFRAFLAYKKFAPIIKIKKVENERKKELQLKMEQEKKANEEKIKRKLQEKKHKEEERKRREEEERTRLKEIQRLEYQKIELRRQEYEKKKEAEKQRREREKQLKLEELKQSEEWKQKEKAARQLVEENERNALENTAILLMGKEQDIGIGDEVFGRELEKNVQEAKDENKKHKENECDKREEMGVVNLRKEEQILPTQEVNSDKIRVSAIKDMPLQTEEIHVHNMEINSKTNNHVLMGSELAICKDAILQIRETEHSQAVRATQSTNKDFNRCHSFASEELKHEDAIVLSVLNHGVETPPQKNQENCSPHCEQDDHLHQHSAYPLLLLDHIEGKRLAWMKTCIPWSKVYSANQRKKVVKKSRQRKTSAANKMPPLNAEIILKTGPWTVLKQVTTVTLEDLPGCSLSTLSECAKLQSLTLRRCGLTALEGLSNCKELKYIDVQDNNIQVINCEDLENLCILLLNSNRLTSVHGLEGCANLKNLELSYNKITRLGGLESQRHLQQLIIDHNQLISTKGLEATPTLMSLDCSFNHLTELEGIQNCGLLQILKLQGNNLSKPPVLENQVLLRELYLDDNSVTALDIISSCWLPLLQILSLSQNSLTWLTSLSAFVSLEKLDISNNCLSDLQNVLAWLDGCYHLCELSLNGNPLLQETDWNCSLLNMLPCLKILNDEALISKEMSLIERYSVPPPGSFLAFCRAQIQELNLLNERRDTELGVACSSLKVAQIHCRYFDELMKLGNEHRYAHEYGILNVKERFEPDSHQDPLKRTSSDHSQQHGCFIGDEENKQNISEIWTVSENIYSMHNNSSMNSKERHDADEHSVCSSGPNLENKVLTSAHVEKNIFTELARERTLGEEQLHAERNIEHFAATVIQCHWRGYVIRRDISVFITLHEAAVVIQTAWRNFCIQRNKATNWKKERESCLNSPWHRHKAATCIQACWKGFYLRKKLSAALAAIAFDEQDEDFEEVNLDDFTFDEAALEKEWLALDSPRFPSKALLFSNQLHRSKNPILTPADMPPMLPWHPHQAWQCDEDSQARTIFTAERRFHRSSSGSRTLTGWSDLKASHENVFRSGKEGIISEEWGFKDVSTAQLMIRRAQKMKSKQARNRKLLDPAVRLALFRNNENKHPLVKPPRKIQPARVEYFRGREEDFSCSDKVPSETFERSKELTYQWLHTQCGDHEATSSRIMKCNRFLPELDPEILNGRRVQLVANLVSREAMDLDLVSMTSGSALTQNKERNSQRHRHSAGSSTGATPATVKVNREPVRKERISFRDTPVHLSGGWGGGKKRAKTFK